VKTNSTGTYTLLVRIQSPANYSLEDYTAQISADSGSISADSTIEVKVE